MTRSALNICFFLLIILDVNKIFSQNIMIGPEIGLGKSETDLHSLQVVWPFDDYYTNYLTIGMEVKYSNNDHLWANSGLEYSRRWNGLNSFNYIKLPISLEVAIGNKIQFIAGCGLSFSYLINYNITSKYGYSGFEETNNKFQLGWFGNIGAGYNFSDSFILRVLYQNNFDITRMYDLSQSSPGGAPYSVPVWGYDGFFKILAMKTLRKKIISPK